MTGTFNRTILELKPELISSVEDGNLTFNRTILELKLFSDLCFFNKFAFL